MKAKIFVAYHKSSFLFKNDIFEPIHVGKANSQLELNMIGDNTGDNISSLNGVYCELTALYWAWKNQPELDYIGLCHYRRFFSYDISVARRIKDSLKLWRYFIKRVFISNLEFSEWHAEPVESDGQLAKGIERFTDKFKKQLTNEDIDIFASRPMRFFHKNMHVTFAIMMGEAHIYLLEKIIQELYPEYFDDLKATLSGSSLYYANMLVVKKDILNTYCSILFPILDEHRKRTENSGWCNNTIEEKCYSRVSGYIGEILTSVFISNALRTNKYSVQLLYQLRLI